MKDKIYNKGTICTITLLPWKVFVKYIEMAEIRSYYNFILPLILEAGKVSNYIF